MSARSFVRPHDHLSQFCDTDDKIMVLQMGQREHEIIKVSGCTLQPFVVPAFICVVA